MLNMNFDEDNFFTADSPGESDCIFDDESKLAEMKDAESVRSYHDSDDGDYTSDSEEEDASSLECSNRVKNTSITQDAYYPFFTCAKIYDGRENGNEVQVSNSSLLTQLGMFSGDNFQMDKSDGYNEEFFPSFTG